jgi:hypothetical protein
VRLRLKDEEREDGEVLSRAGRVGRERERKKKRGRFGLRKR